jgi:hypothetical protein
MKWIRVFMAVVSIGALAPGWAAAQTASVTGRVTDIQNAAVVNATVTLTPSTGRRLESRAGGEGTFSLDQVGNNLKSGASKAADRPATSIRRCRSGTTRRRWC